MTRRYVAHLLRHREREVFMPGLWQLTGYRQRPWPVTKLSKGATSYSITRRIALFINAITSFSDRPLVSIFYTGAGICIRIGALHCVSSLPQMLAGISASGMAIAHCFPFGSWAVSHDFSSSAF